jgi:hypothetical protein
VTAVDGGEEVVPAQTSNRSGYGTFSQVNGYSDEHRSGRRNWGPHQCNSETLDDQPSVPISDANSVMLGRHRVYDPNKCDNTNEHQESCGTGGNGPRPRERRGHAQEVYDTRRTWQYRGSEQEIPSSSSSFSLTYVPPDLSEESEEYRPPSPLPARPIISQNILDCAHCLATRTANLKLLLVLNKSLGTAKAAVASWSRELGLVRRCDHGNDPVVGADELCGPWNLHFSAHIPMDWQSEPEIPVSSGRRRLSDVSRQTGLMAGSSSDAPRPASWGGTLKDTELLQAAIGGLSGVGQAASFPGLESTFPSPP